MLKLSLIQNGVDSLEEAIESFIKARNDGNTRKYKFAILNLCHSLELFLKQILENEHWTLVVEDIDKIGKKPVSDCHTVTISAAIVRIKSICKITFPGIYEEAFQNIIKKRNEIQHYEVELTEELAVKLFAETYSSIKYILDNILKLEMQDYIDDTIIEDLEQINDLYNTLKTNSVKNIEHLGLRRVMFSLSKEIEFMIPCPNCGVKTLAYETEGRDEIKCLFCYSQYNSLDDCFKNDENCYISDELQKQVRYRKGKHDFIFGSCPACGGEILYIDYEDKWLCLTCLEDTGTDYCAECGAPIPGGQGYHGHFMVDDGQDVCIICKDCTNSNRFHAITD